MVNAIQNSVITRAIKEKGVVVLSLEEYEKMREKMEKLKREKTLIIEEAEVLKIIIEGEKEYKEGKLQVIKSLSEII